MTKHMQSFKIAVVMLLVSALAGCQPAGQPTENANQKAGFTFAFLTDIHLQPERHAPEGFNRCIENVNAANPDFVITGGDLIMDALGQTYGRADSLYQMYIEASEKFNMPVYNTMGNHEIFGIYKKSGVAPTHAEYDEKMYENRIGERYYSFDHKGWHFIILDSVDETEAGDAYYGHVDDEQVQWLKNDLQKIDSLTPIVVTVHIPMITVFHEILEGPTTPAGDGLVVTNGKQVLSLFKHHNLKLVLQGHLHILEDIHYGNTHYITGGAVCGKWWQGPNYGVEEGYLLVHVNGDDFGWEYIDYGWDAKAM
jgi:3',5'-cyclic AMP phosphodiesterase CpdA